VTSRSTRASAASKRAVPRASKQEARGCAREKTRRCHVMRTDNRFRAAFLASLALAVGLANLSGCRKKTPAEKVGDKIENAGDKLEDEIDEAN
jgi:hypothetical protein